MKWHFGLAVLALMSVACGDGEPSVEQRPLFSVVRPELSSANQTRTVRLHWVDGDSGETSVDLPPTTLVPTTLQLTAPSASGSAAANRITVSVE